MFISRLPKQRILKAVDPKDPEWKLLHRVADSKLDRTKKAFLMAVAATQAEVIVSRMAEALENNDLASVENMIDWAVFGAGLGIVKEIFQGIVDEVGKATARRLGEKLKAELRFDLLNPRAVEFINHHTGELITQVTEESRQAIRTIIRRAFEEGGHPYQQAKKIIQHIGLTERQSQAVENFRRRLIEDGVSRVKANKQAEAYAKRLLRDRAETVARTETMMASNEGQQEAWRQAVEEGLLDEAEVEREWIVTPDDRLCDRCLAMDGKRASINETYEGGIEGPPLHPRCRCTEGLVERKV